MPLTSCRGTLPGQAGTLKWSWPPASCRDTLPGQVGRSGGLFVPLASCRDTIPGQVGIFQWSLATGLLSGHNTRPGRAFRWSFVFVPAPLLGVLRLAQGRATGLLPGHNTRPGRAFRWSFATGLLPGHNTRPGRTFRWSLVYFIFRSCQVFLIWLRKVWPPASISPESTSQLR